MPGERSGGRGVLDARQECGELAGREGEVPAVRVLRVPHPDADFTRKSSELNTVLVVCSAAVGALAPLHGHGLSLRVLLDLAEDVRELGGREGQVAALWVLRIPQPD